MQRNVFEPCCMGVSVWECGPWAQCIDNILECYFIACLTMDYSNSALWAFVYVCISVSVCPSIPVCISVSVCRLAAYYRNWLWWWWYWCSPHRWVEGAKAMPTLALLFTLCIRVPQKREATNSRPSLPSEVTVVVLETMHRSPIMTHLEIFIHPILIYSLLCTIMHLKWIKSGASSKWGRH